MRTQSHRLPLPAARTGVQMMAVASSALVGALISVAPAVAAPAAVAAPMVTAAPTGLAGAWTNVFDDEFKSTALDTRKWMPNWYGDGGVMNDVATYASNVSVSSGHLNLTLSGQNSGALVSSDVAGGHKVSVGEYVEASVNFPGNGGSINNWPAWWISGPNWPSAGEHDIAEGLGSLTANYHSPSGAHNQGSVGGAWSNGFHTYGVYRAADHADVYWDGQRVKSYRTDDNGQPENMIFNVGGSGTYGAASQMQVDWVRAWVPGPGANPGLPPVAAPPSQPPWWDGLWSGVIAWFQSQVRVLFGG